MIYFVTGVGGFIGSNVADRLLKEGHKVIGYDNFSTGQKKFLHDALKNPNFKLIVNDLLNFDALCQAMHNVDAVWHFAANADVRFGVQFPTRDLQQNTIATSNVLEAMRLNNVKEIYFSSTGSIYGECPVIPTPENAPFPIQTSFYGASKLACEGLISSYCEGYAFNAKVFRFVSILGERYTHGHIFDFIKKLKQNPKELEVLGDGTQRKSYLYINDCIDAMFKAISFKGNRFEVYNLGNNEYCSVKDSVGYIVSKLGLKPTIKYNKGNKGWIGDNPFIYLDTTKIRTLGWSNKLTIKQSVEKTVDWILDNEWVLSAR